MSANTLYSGDSALQPGKFTAYERDGNQSDDAMMRRHNRWHMRFDQPDPYEGSYDLSDPQSLNRYAYVANDPTNFIDIRTPPRRRARPTRPACARWPKS